MTRLTSHGRGGTRTRRSLNRPIPLLGVGKMVTYAVKSPRSTHTRPGTCEEAGCRAFQLGFTITVPIGSDKLEHLKQFMRGELDQIKRLDAKVERDGTVVHVRFAKGTPCAGATRHRVSLNRPESYLVRGGDWRGSTGVIRRHSKPEHWVEDFDENLAKSRKVLNGGG
jgi:hypothetical protein